MKNLFCLALLLFLNTFFANAQEKKFISLPFDSCRTHWQEVAARNKPMGNKKWALAASKEFPLNIDKEIEYRYVISSADSLYEYNIEDMQDKLNGWILLQFSNAHPIIDKITIP